MIRFLAKVQKPDFRAILGKKSEKTNEPILQNLRHGRTDRRTDGRMDGRTWIHRTLPQSGGPKCTLQARRYKKLGLCQKTLFSKGMVNLLKGYDWEDVGYLKVFVFSASPLLATIFSRLA